MRKILGSYNDKAISVIDKYEGYIFNFYHNHPIISYKLAVFALLWFIMIISIITMLSVVGMDHANTYMETEYQNGNITLDNYTPWVTIVKPAYSFSLSSIQIMLYGIIIFMCYFIIRTLIKYL